MHSTKIKLNLLLLKYVLLVYISMRLNVTVLRFRREQKICKTDSQT